MLAPANIEREPVLGTVYLIHFAQPFGHARHYLGWTSGPVDDRLRVHRRGKGAKLMRAVTEAGIEWELVLSWHGVDRHFERRLKNRNGHGRFCPRCQAEREACK